MLSEHATFLNFKNRRHLKFFIRSINSDAVYEEIYQRELERYDEYIEPLIRDYRKPGAERSRG